jgi:hypothetical protein
MNFLSAFGGIASLLYNSSTNNNTSYLGGPSPPEHITDMKVVDVSKKLGLIKAATYR